MPLDATAYQSLIVAEVGDTASNLIAGQIATLWTLNDDQPTEKLQYLHTKRAAIGMLMGAVREQVSQQGTDGVRTDLSDKLKNLSLMLAATERGIADLLTQSQAGIGPQSGELTTTTPISPPCPSGPDANDRAYRGDPYRRPRRRML